LGTDSGLSLGGGSVYSGTVDATLLFVVLLGEHQLVSEGRHATYAHGSEPESPGMTRVYGTGAAYILLAL
jgi:hypothetical protein